MANPAQQTANAWTHVEGDKAYLKDQDGRIAAVPAELASNYVYEQGFAPTSANEVQRERDVAKQGGVLGGTVAAAERLGMGLTDALTAIPRGAASLGYAATGSEALRDFADATSTDKFFRDVAWLEGGAQKEQEFVRAQDAQAAAWPTLTALSRGTGQAIGALGSLGGLAASTVPEGAGAVATARSLAPIAAGEGLAFGATAPFDTLQDVPNTPETREAILKSGVISAILGAAGGAAAPFIAKGAIAATERLRQVFGRAPAEAGAEGAARSVAGTLDGATDDVARAAEAAGPNPLKMQAAAEEAAAKAESGIVEKAGRVTPENWDKVELSDVGKWQHRDTLVEGATRSATKDLDELLGSSRTASEAVREAPLKRELVARNIAEDVSRGTVDETKAIGAAQERIAQARAQLAETVGTRAMPQSKQTVASLTHIFDAAESKLAQVDSAADAYVALDQARREMLRMVPGLKNQSGNQLAHVADQGHRLLEFTEGQYRGLADTLFDEQLWGRQGAIQRSVNQAFVGAIGAEQTGLRNFASATERDIYGRPVLGADPEKIRNYLDRLGTASLRDAEFRRILGTQEKLSKALRDGYELSPAQHVAAERVEQAAQRMRGTLDKAESVVSAANVVKQTNSAERAMAMGRLGNVLTGLSSDGLRGALTGALFPGGRAAALETMAALRDIADAHAGKIAEAMAQTAESLMGSAPKSAKAAGEMARSVRSTRLLTAGQEQSEQRIRGLLLGAGPIAKGFFESTRDLPRAQQFERYQQRRDTLAELVTNPARMQAASQRVLGPIMEANPALGASLQIEAARRLNALYDAMPGRKQPSLIPAKVRDVVSDQELRTAEAYVQATTDPMSVFEDFRKGQLDYQKAQFARQQYPQMFEMAKAALTDILPKLAEDTPDNVLSQLDQLLGMNGALDPSLRPDFLARQATRATMMQQAAAQAQPQPRGPSVTASKQIAGQAQSMVNRMMTS